MKDDNSQHYSSDRNRKAGGGGLVFNLCLFVCLGLMCGLVEVKSNCRSQFHPSTVWLPVLNGSHRALAPKQSERKEVQVCAAPCVLGSV